MALRRGTGAFTASLLLVAASTADLRAAEDAAENFAVHGQFTYTEQETSRFNAPYHGTHSLTPDIGAETIDATVFVGARLWRDTEVWFAPEIDQGFGLDDTVGVAGFPSGEAYKVGKSQPYVRLQRVFLRQTVNLDEEREAVGAGQLQLAGTHSPNRLVITLGKLSVADLFDDNQYAHDPRIDFLNWAAIDAGTFDYAADAWGYTVGAALEWYQGPWALRFGIFDLSDVPNSADLEPAFHEYQYDLEAEKGWQAAGHPGKVRLTAFDSRGRMSLLARAVEFAESSGSPVDVASVRRYRSRLGAQLGLEQEIAEGLGVFARAGKAAGNVETYEFTDIDRTLSAGLSIQGGRWGRAADAVGIAAVLNAISAERERYLNAGGLGVLIGDGRLPHPGPEKIVETYYSFSVLDCAHVSFDYQFIANPGYNRDRGPVSVFAARVHVQF